jgi:hypothetical protein
MTGIVTSGQQHCCPIGSIYILDFAEYKLKSPAKQQDWRRRP